MVRDELNNIGAKSFLMSHLNYYWPIAIGQLAFIYIPIASGFQTTSDRVNTLQLNETSYKLWACYDNLTRNNTDWLMLDALICYQQSFHVICSVCIAQGRTAPNQKYRLNYRLEGFGNQNCIRGSQFTKKSLFLLCMEKPNYRTEYPMRINWSHFQSDTSCQGSDLKFIGLLIKLWIMRKLRRWKACLCLNRL